MSSEECWGKTVVGSREGLETMDGSGAMVRTMMRVGGKNGINQERLKGKVTGMDGTVQSSEIQ